MSSQEFQFGAAHFVFNEGSGNATEITYKVPALRMLLAGRNDLPQNGKWSEAGIYFLIGPGEQAATYRIYVGKSTNLSGRLANHKKSPKKEWFDRALLVTSDRKSSGFSEADIAWLEREFISKLKADIGEVENSVLPGGSEMEPWDKRDLESHISPIEAILRLLGMLQTSYEPQIETDADEEDDPKDDTATVEPQLSWFEAALKVLPADGGGMKSKEIFEAIIAEGHRSRGDGKTPWATLGRDLREHIRQEGDSALVKQVAPATFALNLK